MNTRRILGIGGVVLAFSLGSVAAEEPHTPYVRIAELEIDPARLDAYKAAVGTERVSGTHPGAK